MPIKEPFNYEAHHYYQIILTTELLFIHHIVHAFMDDIQYQQYQIDILG